MAVGSKASICHVAKMASLVEHVVQEYIALAVFVNVNYSNSKLARNRLRDIL